MNHTPRPTPAAWVGIDVSKDTLDACWLPAGGKPRFDVFANDAQGHAALLAWADGHAAGPSELVDEVGVVSHAQSGGQADASRARHVR